METTVIIQEDSLWKRIHEFSLDTPEVCFSFSKKLAKEENWSLDFTRKAIEEYKKFIYLCCILPNGASPSEIVDKVWHMHLIYTQSYWEDFCPNVLKRKLHHHPSKGGFNENLRHKNWLNDTLKNYQKIFQEEAPEEIWNNRDKNRSKKDWTKKLRLVLLLMIPLLLSSCLGDIMGVLSSIALSVMGVLAFGYIVSLFRGENDKGADNGGGGYSCGGSSCSGGGSSCGGGSGCGGGCGGCGG